MLVLLVAFVLLLAGALNFQRFIPNHIITYLLEIGYHPLNYTYLANINTN
jgi:hypothetical protein